jgi:hypothetical protein
MTGPTERATHRQPAAEFINSRELPGKTQVFVAKSELSVLTQIKVSRRSTRVQGCPLAPHVIAFESLCSIIIRLLKTGTIQILRR